MPAFNYSSVAGEYTLTAPIASGATSLTLNSVTGLPSAPFKIVLDPGLTGEEIVKVTGVAGTTLTVVRAWDGSAAQAHAALAKVRHMMTGEDLALSRAHEDATAAHGATGAVVGTTNTQSLTNKDLSSGTNTFPATLLTAAGAATLTNKDLTSASNTFPTTLATLAGAQALTNKDLTGAGNTFPASLVTLTGAQTLSNKTLAPTTLTGGASVDLFILNNNVGGVGKWSPNALEINGGSFKVYYPVDAALIKQQVNVTAPAADVRPLVLKGAASQTANLQEWRSSADAVLASVSSAGAITAPAATINTTVIPKMTFGSTTGTTDASGNLFITHGLGLAPTTVLANMVSSDNSHAKPHGTISSTQFAVHCTNNAGNNLASTSVTIHWQALAV